MPRRPLPNLDPCAAAGCSICCYTQEIPLTQADAARLEAGGISLEGRTERDDEGILVLQKRDGACVFLDQARGRCTVHEIRPEGCRLYPWVWDGRRLRPELDDACPARHDFGEADSKRLQSVLAALRREARA